MLENEVELERSKVKSRDLTDQMVKKDGGKHDGCPYRYLSTVYQYFA